MNFEHAKCLLGPTRLQHLDPDSAGDRYEWHPGGLLRKDSLKAYLCTQFRNYLMAGNLQAFVSQSSSLGGCGGDFQLALPERCTDRGCCGIPC